jgi:SSS family transporter
MTGLDIAVMTVYILAVIGIGVYFSRQRDATDYFLGRHALPWWAVMLSIVATETSALTVISVPGLGACGDLTFLQLPVGYLIGRIGVALWLLPGYFSGENETAYQRLENRFGPATRRVASGTFMGIRALGDSVRVFATAIPLHIVTGLSIPVSIAAVAVATLLYTWTGGIKAVVWVEVLQLAIYVLGGLAALLIGVQLAGGITPMLDRAVDLDKLRIIDWSFSFSETYTLFGGIIGGALLSAASHGTDHLIVQRLLATTSLPDARRALVGSGILVIFQFGLFLIVGTAIWAAGAADPAMSGDEIFPFFAVNYLPSGLSGLVIAGLLAAAMSTLASSLNSLASASTHDFYAPLTGRRDQQHLLSVGRWATVLWAVVLGVLALSFAESSDTPVVELALSIASITYGSLLGTYILGGVARSVGQRDAIIAIAVASATMLTLFLVKPGPFAAVAWPWYVPLGTVITMTVGWTSSRLGGPR